MTNRDIYSVPTEHTQIQSVNILEEINEIFSTLYPEIDDYSFEGAEDLIVVQQVDQF